MNWCLLITACYKIYYSSIFRGNKLKDFLIHSTNIYQLFLIHCDLCLQNWNLNLNFILGSFSWKLLFCFFIYICWASRLQNFSYDSLYTILLIIDYYYYYIFCHHVVSILSLISSLSPCLLSMTSSLWPHLSHLVSSFLSLTLSLSPCLLPMTVSLSPCLLPLTSSHSHLASSF